MSQTGMTQPMRFILAGGTAAAVNWMSRIALSLVLPLTPAILIAYALGMVVGFMLYRGLVFEAGKSALGRQIAIFVLVNAFGALVVLVATFLLKATLVPLEPWLGPALVEAGAHGLAIGIGAFANYYGHRTLTFRREGSQPVHGH